MAWKLQIVLIFKLVVMPDTFFANAKTMKAFVDMDLKLMMKMVDKIGTHAPNFIISSQDFHIKFVKSVINLENS